MNISKEFRFWGFIITISFISSLLTRILITKYLKSRLIHHPPSPPAIPLIGHLHLLSSLLHQSFQNLSSRYGPLMKISIASSSLLVVSNANVAREILKIHDLNFVYRPKLGAQEYNIYAGTGFFNADYGPYWRFIKKTCMVKLLSVQQLSHSADIRRQEMMKLMGSLVRYSEKGEACDLGVELMTMTNNVICRMAMSTRCLGTSNESTQIREFSREILNLGQKLALGEILGPLQKFDFFGHAKKVKALITQFDILMEGIMREHEKEIREGKNQTKDMMDFLLEIYEDESSEVKLSRNNIKSFFLEVFLGGTATTSTALLWVLAELINNPMVFKKLREEIKSAVGSERLVEETDVHNLPYLQAVVKESLRLHPPVPLILRKSKEDCKVNGYDVLKNSRMMINVYAIMRDPNSWDQPNKFLPDRFFEELSKDQLRVLGQDHRFMPFGTGRRSCPGASLAWNVLQTATALLVQCFDWKVKDQEMINMKEGPGVTMANPLLCYPTIHIIPLNITPSMF